MLNKEREKSPGGLHPPWKSSVYHVLCLDLNAGSAHVEAHCKIVGLKICVNDTNSRSLLPKPSRPLPTSCSIWLRDMIPTAGCILLKKI